MWPFKQKVEAPAAEGPKPVPAPVIRRDWVGLPPIQRLIGAHPLTAPSDQFSDDLATHHDPSLSSEAMGHQVSADAPAGLVLALARPTTRSDGPAMIPRPRVQRRAVGAAAESGEWDGDEAAPEPARPTPIPASAVGATRELPVVTPEPPVQRLISLPPNAEPVPVAPTRQGLRAVPTPMTISRQAEDSAEPSGPLTPRRTLGQSRRLGLGAPIARVPDRTVQRAATDSAPDHRSLEGEASVQAAHSPLPAIPQGGRELLGLTQPGRVPLDLAKAANVPMDSPMGTRQTATPSVQLTPDSFPAASDEPRLDMPLARRPVVEGPSSEPALSPADEHAIGPAAPSGWPVQTSSAAVSEPITDSTPMERRTESDLPLATDRPPASSTGAATASLPLVPESRLRGSTAPAAPVPTTAGTLPLVSARPLTATPTLQRFAHTILPQRTEQQPSPSASDEGAPAPALTLPQSRTHEPVSVGEEWLASGASEGFGSHAPMRDAEARVWSPATSLPLAPSRAVGIQRAVGDSDGMPTDAQPEPSAPVVQASWYDSIAAEASGLGSTAATSSAAGGAIASAGSAVASFVGSHNSAEQDMDELAGKLYDRIRTRLKSELLVDRERAGFLTDLR